MKTYTYEVPPELDGERLDLALVAADFGLSRRKIRAAIDAGGVYVNKQRVRISSRKVKAFDRLRLEYAEAALKDLKSRSFRFEPKDILYDQDGIIAVNKPPGLPSQATRDQSVMHVETCLKAFWEERGEGRRKVILVHRLDKETSGILLLATDGARATELTDHFRERRIKKTYWAMVHGIPEVGSFTEKSPLAPIDRKTGMVRVVRAGGKSALTEFRVIESCASLNLTLIECRPATGRSHQIRVHLAHRGYPIVGDKRYGGNARPLADPLASLAARHHLLHAAKLEVPGAEGEGPLRLTAPLPPAFLDFLKAAGIRIPG